VEAVDYFAHESLLFSAAQRDESEKDPQKQNSPSGSDFQSLEEVDVVASVLEVPLASMLTMVQ